MLINYILGALSMAALATAVLFAAPVIFISISIKSAHKNIRRTVIGVAKDNPAVALDRYPALSGDSRINAAWRDYLAALRKASDPANCDITRHFNFSGIVESRVNIFLAELIPTAITVVGTAASAFLLMRGITRGEDVNIEFIYPLLAGLVLGLVFMFLFGASCGSAKKAIDAFAESVQRYASGGFVTAEHLLSEISFTLRQQRESQEKLYEEMTQKTAERFSKSVIPVLKEIEQKIDAFISAAVERQVESMANLADTFVRSLNTCYSDQLLKIERFINNMARIQAEMADSFGNMQEISSASTESLLKLQQSEELVLSHFSGYLEKLGGMSDALKNSLDSMTAITEYMKSNAGSQDKIIQNLARYQEELIKDSQRFTTTMEGVISNIKDQNASSMIALRAVSADMLKSGEHLRSAYGTFSSSLGVSIKSTFEQFDQNLAGISEHLAKSIADLQDAVDELPAILKAIRFEAEGEDTQ